MKPIDGIAGELQLPWGTGSRTVPEREVHTLPVPCRCSACACPCITAALGTEPLCHLCNKGIHHREPGARSSVAVRTKRSSRTSSKDVAPYTGHGALQPGISDRYVCQGCGGPLRDVVLAGIGRARLVDQYYPHGECSEHGWSRGVRTPLNGLEPWAATPAPQEHDLVAEAVAIFGDDVGQIGSPVPNGSRHACDPYSEEGGRRWTRWR